MKNSHITTLALSFCVLLVASACDTENTAFCGNEICDDAETCNSCPQDCGICPGFCGDEFCEDTEHCDSCPEDCGVCPAVCGDALCDDTEHCDSCPEDCGVCPAVCGDALCDDTEHCDSCPEDCGVCQAFTVNLDNARCPDLTPKDKNVAPNETTCASLCENDPGCDLWQYCTLPHESCRLHNNEWTPGNWTRCYVSSSTSSRVMCLPDANNRWIGAARTGSARVPGRTTPVTSKRGFSGYLKVTLENNSIADPSCDDATALGREKGWYYNWMVNTSQGNACRNKNMLWGSGPNDNGAGGVQMGDEFVPMLIGVGQADFVLQNIDYYRTEWTRANVHFLLGYNEPDPGNGSNHPHAVDADVAARDWVKVQQVAAAFDPPLTLVSPAPASEDFDDDGKSPWLDAFFDECTAVPQCDPALIKYIAFHDYRGDPDKLLRRIDGMVACYKRPLWLTEFAGGRLASRPFSRDEHDAYMEAALPMLENHPNVFRYVWFNSRAAPDGWFGALNMLVWQDPEPTLTSTGVIYKNWP